MAHSPRDVTAQWYFDFISPFAYLQFQRLAQLPLVEIHYRPVLFAGLLKHWGHMGPAELEPKRRFTYRYVVWSAERQGIKLRMPPAHPFNPLAVLRLCLALESRPGVVKTLFDFIWREGRDPNTDWPVLCERLSLDTAAADDLIGTAKVKAQLRDNTEEALAANVFGVPTLLINAEPFWGADATDMAADYLRQATVFDSDEMQRVSDLPSASVRRNIPDC